MIQYLLECIAFQLLFLLIYDLFLKKETFFNWNRFYLLASFVLSLVLPWVKLEVLKTTVTSNFITYPYVLWNIDNTPARAITEGTSVWHMLLWYEWLFSFGVIVTVIVFAFKLYKIHSLKNSGEKKFYPTYTKIIIAQSELAFSFFKNVFLGEHIPKEKEANILAHELVHIKQLHSIDLLFFEFIRILLWFNPLVYIYQKRMSELHEFIADAMVAKSNKKQQYQLLLSEVFQIQNISFVNQFFTSSLIKNRIVMLQKQKSKAIRQLKYLLLLPLVMGMLLYTSCEREIPTASELTIAEKSTDDARLITLIGNDLKGKNKEEILKYAVGISNNYKSEKSILSKENYFKQQIAWKSLAPLFFKNRPYKDSSDKMTQIPNPTSQSYNNYLTREQAFLKLDRNLGVSINPKKFNLQIINKLENYPSAYRTLDISTHEKLTAHEIQQLNRMINSPTTETHLNIIIADTEYAFLITKKIES